MAPRSLVLVTALSSSLLPIASAQAADDLVIDGLVVERPTIHTLGVQVLVSEDDDRDATIEVMVRPVGGEFRPAPSLFRVWPETVGIPVPAQFAGSVFDLTPDTTYEIELHAVDPDGLDQTELVTATTRPIPRLDPANPAVVPVSDAASLQAALSSAQPGDVIELAAGAYPGTFSIQASGTPEDPIVIRGADAAGVVIDGEGCTGCNALEVYGSWVHVEHLSITNAERGLRFQGEGAQGNVLRHVIIDDVRHGIGSRPGQQDFYVCDNEIRGRLTWPWVLQPDASSHWDDRGVDLNGDGHVICHNLIAGFGDPMLNLTEGSRSWDFYGNDVRDCFDGIELDRAAGNVRAFRNRWTNVDSAISLQPANGGPVYVLRNELLNVVSEQLKLKATGGEPSGVLVHHNTFVSGDLALNLQTPVTAHHFEISANLFIGPATLSGNRTVDWTGGVNEGHFDHNGYFPDGAMWFGQVDGANRLYDSFADAQASGEVEANGVLLDSSTLADGRVGPADESVEQPPADLALDPSSLAIDAGPLLPGLNGGFTGAAPDLGAREDGCPAPHFGPRAPGDDDVATVECGSPDDPPPGGDDDGGVDDDGGSGSGDSDDAGDGGSGQTDGAEDGGDGPTSGGSGQTDGDPLSGCGCAAAGSAGPRMLWLMLPLWMLRRRRAQRR